MKVKADTLPVRLCPEIKLKLYLYYLLCVTVEPEVITKNLENLNQKLCFIIDGPAYT